MPYLLYIVEEQPFLPLFSSTSSLNGLFNALRSSVEDAFHVFDNYEEAQSFFFGHQKSVQKPLDAIIFEAREDFLLDRLYNVVTADYDSDEEFESAFSAALKDLENLYALRGRDNRATQFPVNPKGQDFDFNVLLNLVQNFLGSPLTNDEEYLEEEQEDEEEELIGGVPKKYKDYTFINYEDSSAPSASAANSANAPAAQSVAPPPIFNLGEDPITYLDIENPVCVPVPGTQKLRVYDKDSFADYLKSGPAAFNNATGQFTCPFTKQRINLNDTFSISKAELQEHIKNQLTAAAPSAPSTIVGQAPPAPSSVQLPSNNTQPLPVPSAPQPDQLNPSELPAYFAEPLPVPSAPQPDQLNPSELPAYFAEPLPVPSAPPAYPTAPSPSAAPISTFFSPPLNERIPAVRDVPNKYQGYTFSPENQDPNNPGVFMDPLTGYSQPVVNPVCVPTQNPNSGNPMLQVYDRASLFGYIQKNASLQPSANGNTFRDPFTQDEINFRDLFSIGNAELAQYVRQQQQASAHTSLGATPRLVMESK